MAKNSSKSSSSRSSSNRSGRSNNRPNPMIPKAGVTRSGRRSYSNGGEVK